MNKRTTETFQVLEPEELCNVPCFKTDVVERLRAEMPDEEMLEQIRVVFAAIADRNRLKILCALRRGQELCVCDVAHALGISVSVASHHLRKLRDLRILKYRNDGKMAYYSVKDRFAAKLVLDAVKWAKA
jgi:DNA-binding transcriptional ArsR family regulator